MKRTTETAELIAVNLIRTPRIETADWLAEIDHGPDEGATEREVIARVGIEALIQWETGGVQPPGWLVNAEARIAAWRRILAAPDDSDTLLVTSNGAARFALFALSTPILPESLKLRTGAFGVVARDDSCDSMPSEWYVSEWDVRP